MVRIKHRYLLINILYPSGQATKLKVANDSSVPDVVQFRQPTPSALKIPTLLRLIQDGVANLFGDYGVGMISGNLKVMYLSTATSTAIIRVSRESYRLVWAALSFATHLPTPLNTPCVIQVRRVSGTIRKSEEAAVEIATDVMRKATPDSRATSTVYPEVKEPGTRFDVMEVDDAAMDESDASDG